MSGEEYLLSLLNSKAENTYSESVYINQRACPFLKYYKDRLTVKYLGKGLLYSDITSIQSNKPAKRNTSIYYFEVKINDIGHRGDISIGLADADFPLNKHPGWTKKSYGYKADGKVYSNKQAGDVVMPKFTSGNIVGCGINYFKREIFFTYNGEYTGPAFKDVELKEFHATIGLHSLNESVTFNFGNKPFKFDLEKMILEEKREGVKSIIKQPINHYSLHQIVHSYLNFHGYANTLEAFEKAAQIERKDVGLPRSEVFEEPELIKEEKILEEDGEDGEGKGQKRKRKKTGDEDEMEIETSKREEETHVHNGRNHNNNNTHHNGRAGQQDNRFRSDSLRIEFESPNFNMIKDQLSGEVEPFTLNSDNSNSQSRDFILLKKASMHIDFNNPNVNPEFTGLFQKPMNQNFVRNTDGLRPNTYLLHERAHVREILLEGKISEAMSYIKSLFPTLFDERKELLKVFHAQQFIEYVRIKDFQNAIIYSQKYLIPYQKENIYCLDSRNVIQEVPIDTMMALLCYPDPENSDLKNFLDVNQRDLVADIANKEILRKMGFIDKSILDILIGQITVTEQAYREHNSHYGDVFEFKV